jgi:hypothetical protein
MNRHPTRPRASSVAYNQGSRPVWGLHIICYLLGVGQETFGLTPM